jgi:hypothetical protein
MDSGTTTQLTTTLVEGRKLKAAQRAEAQKRVAEHASWLRNERVKARPTLTKNRDAVEARWRERRNQGTTPDH